MDFMQLVGRPGALHTGAMKACGRSGSDKVWPAVIVIGKGAAIVDGAWTIIDVRLEMTTGEALELAKGLLTMYNAVE